MNEQDKAILEKIMKQNQEILKANAIILELIVPIPAKEQCDIKYPTLGSMSSEIHELQELMKKQKEETQSIDYPPGEFDVCSDIGPRRDYKLMEPFTISIPKQPFPGEESEPTNGCEIGESEDMAIFASLQRKPWIAYSDTRPVRDGVYPVVIEGCGSVTEVALFEYGFRSSVWKNRSGNKIDVRFWADEWLGDTFPIKKNESELSQKQQCAAGPWHKYPDEVPCRSGEYLACYSKMPGADMLYFRSDENIWQGDTEGFLHPTVAPAAWAEVFLPGGSDYE